MNGLSEAEREEITRLFGWVPESEPLEQMLDAVEAIVAARLASVEALADEWAAMSLAPLTDDQADGIRLRARSREAMYHWCARALRAVLGSDAHAEQKGTGE